MAMHAPRDCRLRRAEARVARRQCGASIERSTAVQAVVLPGARGAAVAYAEDRERVFRRGSDSSEGEHRETGGRGFESRSFHHWIAQSGRASDVNPSVAGSIPAPTTTCTVVRPGRKALTGSAPCGVSPDARPCLARNGTPQRRGHRVRAFEANRRSRTHRMTATTSSRLGATAASREHTRSATSTSGSLPPISSFSFREKVARRAG